MCEFDIAAPSPPLHIACHTMHLDPGYMNKTSNQNRGTGDV